MKSSERFLCPLPINGVWNLRHSYGKGHKNRSDDFIVCRYLFGGSDDQVEWMLRAFALEDETRGTENLVFPSVTAPTAPTLSPEVTEQLIAAGWTPPTVA